MKRLTKKQVKEIGVAYAAYVRIVRAEKAGRGIRLSLDEVEALATGDDAIFTAAQVALDKLGLEE